MRALIKPWSPHQKADWQYAMHTQRQQLQPPSRRVAYLPGRRCSSSLVVVMAATADGPRRTVLWFRNDLRVHDSATIHEAVQRVKAGQTDEVQWP